MKVFTIKEKYELGNNINSKVLAFAFGLSAEFERQLISQHTKEALARKKSEGKTFGRPKGSLSKQTKLSGKEDQIKELLSKKVSYSAIGRIMGANRITIKQFVELANSINTYRTNQYFPVNYSQLPRISPVCVHEPYDGNIILLPDGCIIHSAKG